jgi:hypothetical protein
MAIRRSMPEMLRECPTLVGGVDDDAYVAQIWAREMSDGLWEAWPRRTNCDTTQSTRAAIEYWASSVTSIYLQGAFARSRPVRVSAA